MTSNAEFVDSSCLFGANAVFIEEMYSRFVEDPHSVDSEWQAFFNDLGDELNTVIQRNKGASWKPHDSRIVGYKEDVIAKKGAANDVVSSGDVTRACNDSIQALRLIHAYRRNGHLLADLDPLGIDKPTMPKELDPAFYGFGEEDYDRPIFLGGIINQETATLREILTFVRKNYSTHIGVEFMHIQDEEQRDWIREYIESAHERRQLPSQERQAIFQDIMEVEYFEQFLHKKYPGAKRFSVEGGESSVIATQAVISKAAELGVKEIVIGMPHRGRLNTLTKVMGKPYHAMLSEFQGNLAHPEEMGISGDVKYHLGTSSDRKFTDGREIHLSLTPNPSHLEAVNPVVTGKVRAKQDKLKDEARDYVFGVLLHGDAAFAGQGVVAESLVLGDLEGYTTGGTIHVIVNNQIGFTTSPKKARLSRYPTEIAKFVQLPIFHVNGDDPEAVVYVSKLAVEFRQRFKKDVVIDVICYRKYGHNEGDEPFFTQPAMYSTIAKRQTPVDVYAQTLIQDGVLTADDVTTRRKEYHAFLDNELSISKDYKPNKADWLEGHWSGFTSPKRGVKPKTDTGVKLADLKKLGASLSKMPDGYNLNNKIVRNLEARAQMIKSGENIDWAMAEALAYASLLVDEVPVRLSGQDSGRGTFSHRHSVLVDQDNENQYLPLNNLSKGQARYEVIDSNLSEYAVLGYEYGYSATEPNALTLWEAQFGDFANGAQIIIDQFVASGEHKWLRMSGVVLLLPHGYEGQGPEHSSARLERFLQLCAEDNMQVVNCTTPANFFHVLRRQIYRDFRKPLIVMTPKSLLRHKLAISSLEEFKPGTHFNRVIGEIEKLDAAKVRRVIISSGKVYYDLLEERQKRNIKDVALVRLEQFYPFPDKDIIETIKPYKKAELVWCQEEPKNMGGWTFVEPFLEEAIKRPDYVGRPASASPAVGYAKLHAKELKKLMDEAFGK